MCIHALHVRSSGGSGAAGGIGSMESLEGKGRETASVSQLVGSLEKNSFDVAIIAQFGDNAAANSRLCRGIAKSVKALDFDSSIPRFESLFPCH